MLRRLERVLVIGKGYWKQLLESERQARWRTIWRIGMGIEDCIGSLDWKGFILQLYGFQSRAAEPLS